MSTRNYLKLALFFIALVLFNCQQEDDSIKPEPTFVYENPLYQQQIVNLSEIPEIERSIRSTYPSIFRNTNISNSTASSTSASNTTIIDVDHILEIVDTLNNKNYSIRFRFNDTPLSEFYNLVIGKDTLGFTTEPFVLKYKCDASQLDQYISNDFDFSYFKGTMELHKYTDYFQEGSLTTTIGGDTVNCPKEFDEVGDPIPCETTPVDPVGSGGGSSDDGSGITGGPLDSDFGVDSDASDDLVWICFHRLQSHPDPSYCNDPDAGGFWVVNTSAPPQESGEIHNESGIKVDDCPDCDISSPTGIGINPIPMETVRTALKRNLNLNEAGIAFIGHSDNNRAVTQVYYYIEPYLELNVTISPEAKAFAESTIDILSSPIITSNIQLDYKAAILKMTNHLKLYGEIEDEIYADYIESLIPEFNSMLMEEVRAIYLRVKRTVNELTINYAKRILTVVVTDLVIPVITYAIFEATAGTAIKLLQKIPVSMVLQGYRLNKMVTKIAQLGVQGNQAHVRELHGTTASKAQELFITLIKNAASTSNPNNYTTVANMGNSNFITFRTYSGGLSEGVIATIDLNFSSLFSNIVKLKFYP